MSVKITDNTSKVAADIRSSAALSLRFALEDIQRTSEPRTPKRDGFLRRGILMNVLGLSGTIVWNTNYAIFQETKQFKNYTTPGTGPHFAENAVNQIDGNMESYFKKARLI